LGRLERDRYFVIWTFWGLGIRTLRALAIDSKDIGLVSSSSLMIYFVCWRLRSRSLHFRKQLRPRRQGVDDRKGSTEHVPLSHPTPSSRNVSHLSAALLFFDSKSITRACPVLRIPRRHAATKMKPMTHQLEALPIQTKKRNCFCEKSWNLKTTT